MRLDGVARVPSNDLSNPGTRFGWEFLMYHVFQQQARLLLPATTLHRTYNHPSTFLVVVLSPRIRTGTATVTGLLKYMVYWYVTSVSQK